MKTYDKLTFILSKNQRKKFFILIFSITIVSFLDLASIGALVPILIIFSDPSFINNEYIIYILEKFDFLNKENFLFFSIAFLFLIFLFKIILSTVLHYIKFKILWDFYSKINNRLMRNYLNLDYSEFIKLKIYEKTNIVKSEVEYFVMGVIEPFLVLFLEGLTIFFIFCFLAFYDPQSTLKLIVSISLIVVSLMYFFGKRLKKYGFIRHNLNNFLQLHINQGFHGIKDVKLASKEGMIIQKFSEVTKLIGDVMSKISFWQSFPRHFLEFLTILSFIFICYIGVSSGKNFSELIVILGLYAAATFRIMPSFNRVLVSFNSIKQTKTVIDKIYQDLQLIKTENINNKNLNEELHQLDIHDIKIKNLNFKFLDDQEFLIQNLNLDLKKGEYVGIFGKSGTGKTTFVDLFSGLLKPNSGSIEFDNKDIFIHQNLWKRSIAYVPQFIYLNNTTIKENIAFGEKIDENKVIKSLDEARLTDFVNSLPKGINTEVGENGVNLSGGQIQRLGIARALYRNSKILIFDESTNSLDLETEKEFMDVVNKIKGKKIIIFISHKLMILKQCDRVFELEDKKLKLKNL